MSNAALKRHAVPLPGATHDIKLGCDCVASVGRNRFFMGGPEPSPWSGCSFKVDEHRFLKLSGLHGFTPRLTSRA